LDNCKIPLGDNMSLLETKKKNAEIMRMRSNIMDAEVQIEERKEEIVRIETRIESFKDRITTLEEELNKNKE